MKVRKEKQRQHYTESSRAIYIMNHKFPTTKTDYPVSTKQQLLPKKVVQQHLESKYSGTQITTLRPNFNKFFRKTSKSSKIFLSEAAIRDASERRHYWNSKIRKL